VYCKRQMVSECHYDVQGTVQFTLPFFGPLAARVLSVVCNFGKC
jgi:hypothetical protein